MGADKAILNTKAFCENGQWHLNGQKAFCTGAGHAGVYMVMTDTTDGKGFFLVSADNPGLRIGEPMDSMGLQGTHSGVVGLDNAIVPDTERVGQPGHIGPIINLDMQSGLHSGIVATGIALGAFTRLLDIVKANNSFDKYESVRVRVSQTGGYPQRDANALLRAGRDGFAAPEAACGGGNHDPPNSF